MKHVVPAGSRSRTLLATLTALVAAGLVVAGVFGSTGGAATKGPSAASKSQLAQAELDAKFWRQLVGNFKSGTALGLKSMSDHYVMPLEGGLVLGLHFDNTNLAKAQNLNWVAIGIPGVFTKADQARVNKLYGPGVTHFHDPVTDVHGGKPGAKGVWFIHVGARNFTSPFGKVTKSKVDPNFMPTAPPS